MRTAAVVAVHLFARHDDVPGTIALSELTLTTTRISFAVGKLPLLQPPYVYVFPKEHVESRVDVFQGIVTNKEDAIEAVQDHANLSGGIPAVVTLCGGIWRIKSMATTCTQGLQE